MTPHKKHGRLRTSQFYWDFAMSVLGATAWMATQIGRRENLQKKSRGRNEFALWSRSGLRSDMANEQSHNRGRRGAPNGSPRATSDWVGNRRATLTNGFVLNTIGRPAYSFPSDSPSSLQDGGTRAKNECFLRHGSVPKHGWCANKSLQATRDGCSSSASRLTLVGPARLSSGR
jgi:hypothetical protein